jgi:outer membrane protein TolC
MRVRVVAARIALATLAMSLPGEVVARAQDAPSTAPAPALVRPAGVNAPPETLTLQDALQRARQNDAQFQAATADARSATEDRVQARAGLLPTVSFTTQYIGNQPNGINPTGRFVSMDGVSMYRVWGVVKQDLSPGVFAGTSLLRARAAEAEAAARLEVAQRGLAVTVTRIYYALVIAQRKYATAQESAEQASRFLAVAQRQQQLGQVAMSDVIKARIQSRQQAQAFNEAALTLDVARLNLAVLLSPDVNENVSVVDDLAAPPALPAFADVNAMAGRGNPDVRAAQAAVSAATADVRSARFAMLPSVAVEVDYGIEANELALHSRIAAQPELGVLPNLGYAASVNLTVPVWDWGGARSRVRQAQVKDRAARVALSQAQRGLLSSLYAKYNEALVAQSAVENAKTIVDLAAESLRLTNLRYTAGESSALEVVDAQNTAMQARYAFDDAGARYRVALADLQTLTGSF